MKGLVRKKCVFSPRLCRRFIGNLLFWGVATFAFPAWACTYENWSDHFGVDDGGLTAGGAAEGIHHYSGACGLRVRIDDEIAHFVEDQSPANESHYIARFYIYWGDVAMSDGDDLSVFAAYSPANDPELELSVTRLSGHDELFVGTRLDNGNSVRIGTGIPMAPGWHGVEVDWSASAGEGANNGTIRLNVDGTTERVLPDLNNDLARIAYARLGAVNGSMATTTGSFDLDGFVSKRSGIIDSDRDKLADATDSDDDNDHIPDSWENDHQMDALNPLDSLADRNLDGITNLDEYLVSIGAKSMLGTGLNLLHPGPGPTTCQQLLVALGTSDKIQSVTAYDPQSSSFFTCDHDGGQDFGLESGKAYLVYMHSPAAVRTPGKEDCEPLYLSSGVNLIGHPAPVQGLTCVGLLAALGDEIASSLQRLNRTTGAFETCGFLEHEVVPMPRGFDFPITPGEGYLLSVRNGATVTLPGCE